MKKALLYISIICFCCACNKDIPMPPEPEPEEPVQPCDIVDEDTPLVVDWCQLLLPDTSFVDMVTVPILYKDIIATVGFIGEYGENRTLFFYDKKNGQLRHQIPIEELNGNVFRLFSKGKYLIVPYSFAGIEVYDMESFELVWRYKAQGQESNSPRVLVSNDEIYVPIMYGDLPYVNATTVTAFNIATGQRRFVFSVSKDEFDGGSPVIPSVQIDTLDNGDIVHYVAITALYDHKLDEHHCWAYNESQGAYLWKNNEIDANIVHRDPLIVYGDAVTVLGNDLHTLNKYTGEEINKVDISGSYGYCAPKLHNGRIYAKSAQKDLICADAATGELMWYNDNAGTIPQKKLTIYKDRLYYSGFDEYLYVFDLANGEMLYDVNTPFKGGEFHTGGQVIDPETDYMYTTDGFRLMQLELLR